MSKKQLDTSQITSELSGASVFFQKPKNTDSPTLDRKSETKEQISNQSIDQSTNRPTDQPIDQSISQSTNQSTDELTDIELLGPVVSRPKAFYITQKVDRWLDKSVQHMQEKGLHKVDRSVLLNAMLHDPTLYKGSELEKLKKRILAHLTNKSLKRG